MKSHHKIFWLILGIILILLIILLSFVFYKTGAAQQQILNTPSITPTSTATSSLAKDINIPMATPNKVKAIYITGSSFGSTKRRAELFNLVETTELNSVVIDIKDYKGKLMFQPTTQLLAKWPVSSGALNYQSYQDILSQLNQKGIYTIARITTFQDQTAAQTYPNLGLRSSSGGLWLDRRGQGWLDMTNHDSWRLIAGLAKEAYTLGYDEVQFDYIRFPSDGDLTTIRYSDLPKNETKYQKLNDFFSYLKEQLKDTPMPLSVDLFGLTYYYRKDKSYDLGIGQRLIDAGQYFNYISPMVYPSHYYGGFLNFSNPAEHPYEVINRCLSDGNRILSESSSTAQTRPWLQDFNMGAIYDGDMVRKEIKAADDNSASGWILWNASNIYTRGALNPK